VLFRSRLIWKGDIVIGAEESRPRKWHDRADSGNKRRKAKLIGLWRGFELPSGQAQPSNSSVQHEVGNQTVIDCIHAEPESIVAKPRSLT
jgi:hypothetical protein